MHLDAGGRGRRPVAGGATLFLVASVLVGLAWIGATRLAGVGPDGVPDERGTTPASVLPDEILEAVPVADVVRPGVRPVALAAVLIAILACVLPCLAPPRPLTARSPGIDPTDGSAPSRAPPVR